MAPLSHGPPLRLPPAPLDTPPPPPDHTRPTLRSRHAGPPSPEGPPPPSPPLAPVLPLARPWKGLSATAQSRRMTGRVRRESHGGGRRPDQVWWPLYAPSSYTHRHWSVSNPRPRVFRQKTTFYRHYFVWLLSKRAIGPYKQGHSLTGTGGRPQAERFAAMGTRVLQAAAQGRRRANPPNRAFHALQAVAQGRSDAPPSWPLAHPDRAPRAQSAIACIG